MAKREENQPAVHTHRWAIGRNLTEEHCTNTLPNGKPCYKLRIAQQELDGRQKDWDKYYADCKTTEAAFDFWEMKKAWVSMNKPLIQETLKRVKTRIQRNSVGEWEDLPGVERLPRPKFPDPEGGMYVTSN